MAVSGKSQLRVIIPAYNEESALPSVIEEWLAALRAAATDFEIHLYNDGSCDGTAAIIDEASRREPRVIAHHQANRGHGPTVLAAYREHADADWLFQADADGEISAEHFSELWSLRHDQDLVLGRRTNRPQAWYRRVLTKSARHCVRLFSGHSFEDTNIPFRLMRSESFRPAFDLMSANAYAPNVLVVTYAGRMKLRTKEVPVPYQDRRGPAHRVSLCRWARNAARCAWDAITFHRRLMRHGARAA